VSPDTSDPERPVDRAGDPADPQRGDADLPRHPADPPLGDADLPRGDVDLPRHLDAAGAAPVAVPPPYVTPVTARPARGVRRSVVLTVGLALLITVLGAPLGLLWAAVAPDTPVVKTPEGAIYGTTQPEQPVAADGWFTLLGLGFGVLVALALWFLLRRRRGPLGLLAGTLGGLGAAVVAWQLGRRIGLAGYRHLLATAPDGRAFGKPADLRAGGVHWLFDLIPLPYGNLLLPAFGAAVAYTLLAGWSRWPSLRPEPEAGWPPVGADQGWPALGGGGLSSGPAGPPAPSTAPEPPGPGAAEPPRG
jgi:hypothetical protein